MKKQGKKTLPKEDASYRRVSEMIQMSELPKELK